MTRLRPLNEIFYRIPGRVEGHLAGTHQSREAGLGTQFYGVTDFLHHPDLRRLELRRSFTDPFRRLHVRIFERRSAATVVIAADLSASMIAAGSKRLQLATLTEGLAMGARRLGDRFGFVGFDRQVRRGWVMPPMTATGWVRSWCERLNDHPWQGEGAQGALQLAQWLPARRCLVILVSDFHWPDGMLPQVLGRLGTHLVVPVVLWSRAETEDWPRWGIRRVVDAETGGEILVWLHPRWRPRLQERYRQRRRTLQRLFRISGCQPLWLEDAIDPRRIERHFHALAG
ncbi:hypothetical protein MIT9_P2077 [Methylomarinovum caldicuralii]|uniref:DUF58 domain-containing protein n=1 Tax=Methylomarinovum caldicuralii TaxID=438856 RepID=A0AAU9CA68_9GAMM|nr:hypothetical protein [Methylomarinovum caldicuralii]BCX82491.1 hypothetical protein MIT9_P2077 [Methylomarinovum caldicuralii]